MACSRSIFGSESKVLNPKDLDSCSSGDGSPMVGYRQIQRAESADQIGWSATEPPAATFALSARRLPFYRQLTATPGVRIMVRMDQSELRQILDFTPQLIAVYGPNRERLYVNRIGLDYLGLSLQEWRQTPERGAFVHPDDRARELDCFDRARSTGSAYEVELRLRGGHGTHRWFLARSKPVRDDHGQIMRLYVACTDIGDRKTAEERLQQENIALREEVDRASMFEEIVGASPALTGLLARVCKVAGSDSTGLISGETGTGKELVAREIHRRPQRA